MSYVDKFSEEIPDDLSVKFSQVLFRMKAMEDKECREAREEDREPDYEKLWREMEDFLESIPDRRKGDINGLGSY